MRTILLALPVRCMLVGLAVYLLGRMQRGWRPPASALAALVVTALPFWGQLAKRSVDTAREVPMWDMQLFSTYFEAVRWGQDPYDPARMATATRDLGRDPLDADFAEQVIRVGVAYPPSSLPLFGAIGRMPRGLRPYAWHALIWCGLALSVVMIARKAGGGLGALSASLLLVGTWPGTLGAVGYSQLILIVGPLLMLAALARDDVRRSVFTALACIVNLLGCVGLILPLLGRRWRALVLSLGLLLAMFAWGALGVGGDAVSRFFRNGPYHNAPMRSFTEGMNQSIVGVLMRTGAATLPHPGSPAVAASWAIVIVVIAATLYQGRRHLTDLDRLGILMPAALLIYVGTLQTYSLLLLPSLIFTTRFPSALGGATLAALICGLVGTPGDWSGFIAAASTFIAVCLSSALVPRGPSSDAAHAALRTPPAA